MTPAELDELERLAAAATPGPWAGDAYHISTADFDVAEYENPADARLAAAAVNAIPRLVAEVRRGQKLGALLSAWPECPDCGGDGLGPMYCAGPGESPEQDDCPTCGGLGAVTPWFVRLKARADALVAALRTAEAERLTLARAFDAATRDLDCGDNSCRFKAHGKGGMRTNGGCQCLGVKDGGGLRGVEVSRAVEVARRIVADADAAAKEAG